MTRRGQFLELRPFSGQTLEACLGYLRRDVAKAFADLFAVLGQRREVPVFKSIVVEDGDIASTGNSFVMAALTLPKGRWHLTATAVLDGAGSSNSFTNARMWIDRDVDGGITTEAVLGHNYTYIIAGQATDSGTDTVTHIYTTMPLMCQWRIDVDSESVMTLAGRSIYTGGGTPKFYCALVAHGYVME